MQSMNAVCAIALRSAMGDELFYALMREEEETWGGKIEVQWMRACMYGWVSSYRKGDVVLAEVVSSIWW